MHPQSREKWNAANVATVEKWTEAGTFPPEQVLFLKKRLVDTEQWLYLMPDGVAGWYTATNPPGGLVQIKQDDGSMRETDVIGPVTDREMTVLSNLGESEEVRLYIPSIAESAVLRPARGEPFVGDDGLLRTPITESFEEGVKPWFKPDRFGSSTQPATPTNSAAAPAMDPGPESLQERTPAYQMAPMHGSMLVHPDRGLLVLSAAKALLKIGPLRYGTDGQFWAFDGGVWVPGEKLVHARIVQLLGEDYRMAHRSNIRSATETLVPEMDCSPVEKWINFRNGLLDWRTGDFVEHTPEVASTIQLQTEWTQAPAAQCPNFDAFLAQILDPEDVPRMWEIIGYLMMSGNPLQKAFLFKGQGRNGKGALLRTITLILGDDHISNISLHDLADNRFAPAGLFGKTANICGDIDARYVENTGLFKMITGQDRIEAEHKGKTRFRFLAWAVPVFSANGIPGSADTSSGWVDRWEVVHFGMNLSGKEDRSVEQRMQTEEELRGIAAKAVVALRTLQDRGRFEATESSRKAKQSFQENSNPVAAWLADQEQGDKAWSARTVAWSSFKSWARDAKSGENMSRNRFYEAMRNQGLAETTRAGTIGFAGVEAKEPSSVW